MRAQPATVFAGGSNIAIPAMSQNQDLAQSLLRIMFSEEYQTMLAENGLIPGNSQYADALGDDPYAQAALAAAVDAKLTPAGREVGRRGGRADPGGLLPAGRQRRRPGGGRRGGGPAHRRHAELTARDEICTFACLGVPNGASVTLLSTTRGLDMTAPRTVTAQAGPPAPAARRRCRERRRDPGEPRPVRRVAALPVPAVPPARPGPGAP